MSDRSLLSSYHSVHTSMSRQDKQQEEASDPDQVLQSFALAVPVELRLRTFGHVITNYPPVDITQRNSHIPPAWTHESKDIERLWWQNINFVFPDSTLQDIPTEFCRTILQQPDPHPITIQFTMEWDQYMWQHAVDSRPALQLRDLNNAFELVRHLRGRKGLYEVSVEFAAENDRRHKMYRSMPDLLCEPLERFLRSLLNFVAAFFRGEIQFGDVTKDFLPWFPNTGMTPDQYLKMRYDSIVSWVVNGPKPRLWKKEDGDRSQTTNYIKLAMWDAFDAQRPSWWQLEDDSQINLVVDEDYTEVKIPLPAEPIEDDW